MGSQDEMIALVEAAAKIPCEALHRPGAPCCVCNPQRTIDGYTNAPYYFQKRLALARMDAEMARRFGPPVLPRHGPVGPLYAPRKTFADLARRYLVGAARAAKGTMESDLDRIVADEWELAARPVAAQADGDPGRGVAA